MTDSDTAGAACLSLSDFPAAPADRGTCQSGGHCRTDPASPAPGPPAGPGTQTASLSLTRSHWQAGLTQARSEFNSGLTIECHSDSESASESSHRPSRWHRGGRPARTQTAFGVSSSGRARSRPRSIWNLGSLLYSTFFWLYTTLATIPPWLHSTSQTAI